MSAVFAALVAIFGKIGIHDIDSTLATTVRSIVMAGFLIIISLMLGKFKLWSSLDNKSLIFIVLAGISGATSWLFYFLALRFGPATGVVALDKLSVVFVAIFAAIFLAEKMTWNVGLGVVLITTGALLMSLL